jgi:hypothetical protein
MLSRPRSSARSTAFTKPASAAYPLRQCNALVHRRVGVYVHQQQLARAQPQYVAHTCRAHGPIVIKPLTARKSMRIRFSSVVSTIAGSQSAGLHRSAPADASSAQAMHKRRPASPRSAPRRPLWRAFTGHTLPPSDLPQKYSLRRHASAAGRLHLLHAQQAVARADDKAAFVIRLHDMPRLPPSPCSTEARHILITSPPTVAYAPITGSSARTRLRISDAGFVQSIRPSCLDSGG